ncbi:MAG: helix-turn-helix domain-containing protein [Limosilactobacillus vaginalis]|uniref:helix-turn-helix domain-containing protein n=1 Tax=Limosilactobacillus vaginalis TaxID=1633 RepID=UPI003F0D8C62
MNRIQELREEHGLSLQQLSEAIKKQSGKKISKASLSNYEREDQQPKKETWQALANFFHVNLSYIMGLSPTRNAVDERLYKSAISRLIELTSGNYSNGPKVRKIVRFFSLLLERTKNNEEYLDHLYELIGSISTINPYPDNDSVTLNFSNGEELTPFESAKLINKHRLKIEEASNYFVYVALDQLEFNHQRRERREQRINDLKIEGESSDDYSQISKRIDNFENKSKIIDENNFDKFKHKH